jgi:hypothetical protein
MGINLRKKNFFKIREELSLFNHNYRNYLIFIKTINIFKFNNNFLQINITKFNYNINLLITIVQDNLYLKKNLFIYFSFLNNFLIDDIRILKFYSFYKYILNIGKYLVNHFYPKNFFFSFINFTHQKRFSNLDETLYTVLFSKYIYLFKKPYINYKYIFEIFYNTFKYKNINFLVIFLKNLFKNVNFYKHQFLLFYLRCFMKLLNLPIFREFKVNGIFIKFHGKIAKAGNSRRKKFLLQHQVISTAYKNNYIVEKFQLHSFTGVVGCTLILSF